MDENVIEFPQTKEIQTRSLRRSIEKMNEGLKEQRESSKNLQKNLTKLQDSMIAIEETVKRFNQNVGKIPIKQLEEAVERVAKPEESSIE